MKEISRDEKVILVAIIFILASGVLMNLKNNNGKDVSKKTSVGLIGRYP